MHDDRRQRVIGGERLSCGDILQIEGHAVGHPGAGLRRSAIPCARKEVAVWAIDVNLDDLHVRSIPTECSSSRDRIPIDRYWIGAGGQRGWCGGWERRIEGSETDMGWECVCARRSQVDDVRGRSYRRVVQGDLQGRV